MLRSSCSRWADPGVHDAPKYAFRASAFAILARSAGVTSLASRTTATAVFAFATACLPMPEARRRRLMGRAWGPPTAAHRMCLGVHTVPTSTSACKGFASPRVQMRIAPNTMPPSSATARSAHSAQRMFSALVVSAIQRPGTAHALRRAGLAMPQERAAVTGSPVTATSVLSNGHRQCLVRAPRLGSALAQ